MGKWDIGHDCAEESQSITSSRQVDEKDRKEPKSERIHLANNCNKQSTHMVMEPMAYAPGFRGQYQAATWSTEDMPHAKHWEAPEISRQTHADSSTSTSSSQWQLQLNPKGKGKPRSHSRGQDEGEYYQWRGKGYHNGIFPTKMVNIYRRRIYFHTKPKSSIAKPYQLELKPRTWKLIFGTTSC